MCGVTDQKGLLEDWSCPVVDPPDPWDPEKEDSQSQGLFYVALDLTQGHLVLEEPMGGGIDYRKVATAGSAKLC